ncbi:MAG: mechanosensitive ion channel [Alphaproteobacteria bacterium]
MQDFLSEYEPLVASLTTLAVQHALSALGGVLILVAGWIVAGWARRTVLRAMRRVNRVDVTLTRFLAGGLRYLVLALTLLLVLAQFGIQTASFIAVLGAAGLAVGLALQGTLSNVAAGVMILFLRPFRVDEFIDAGGLMGTVDEIGLFATHMKTLDGNLLIVPNGRLWSSEVVNWSRLPTRRQDIQVGVSYSTDLDRALAVLREELDKDPRVLQDPEPMVAVNELGDSAVVILCRFWAAASDAYTTKLHLNKAIKQRLDLEGMEIPFPQRVMHMLPPQPS